uniref:Uncharacterized protein n=1 Tax=Acrobeloides nanus TaxID=290746 RepID=A0A914DPU0_9BILA
MACLYQCKRYTLYDEGHLPELCGQFRTKQQREERCDSKGQCKKCLFDTHSGNCKVFCRHCQEARNPIRKENSGEHHRAHCLFKWGSKAQKSALFERYCPRVEEPESPSQDLLMAPDDIELVEGLAAPTPSLPWYQEKDRPLALAERLIQEFGFDFDLDLELSKKHNSKLNI